MNCADDFSIEQVKSYTQLLDRQKGGEAFLRNSDVRYRVAVKATVFHESGSTTKKFSSNDVETLIQYANEYLNTIDVELYLQSGVVNHVFDDSYYNFLDTQESELRSKYDVKNAINLYLFSTIFTEEGDVFLNGSAALPNLSNNSNRIFLSYLDRNQADFETLKNKVFPHELGHYFGLLHTFRDSNNPEVTKRELVTRDLGSGANCAITGDLLCDTAADPFERLTSISSYNCNETLPPDLIDAYGSTFTPPTDNIMSYHVRCGNEFTNGQYQRMKESFSIRFSPNAAYNLLGNQANYLITNKLAKEAYCEGELITVTYNKTGSFAKTNNFYLEISDSDGNNFTEVQNATYLADNEIRFTIPNGMKSSSNYQVRVVSRVPYLEGTVSENFTVHTAGNLRLSLSASPIRPNDTSNLLLDFSGSGPWQVVFDNGIMLSNIRNRRHQIRLKPLKTNTYSIVSATGLCGDVNVENDATLVIAEPSLKVEASFSGKGCQKSFFQIPISGLRTGAADANYIAKFSNADTTFNSASNVAGSTIYVLAPDYFVNKNNNYELVIEGTKPEDYSLPVPIEVFPKPAPPEAESVVSFCFNSKATALQATGSNIKWYLGQTNINSLQSLVPTTTKTGVFYYYVTQTNGEGCESNRKEIQVNVREPATAAISGDTTIKFGDRTALSVKLMGNAPWNFELSDGQKFQTPDPEFYPEVQPLSTETYTLRKAEDACGDVFLTGSAKIVVLKPLSINEDWAADTKVFPNPVVNLINVSLYNTKLLNKPLSISVVDILGRNHLRIKHHGVSLGDNLVIPAEGLPTGVYLLNIESEALKISKRVVIKQ